MNLSKKKAYFSENYLNTIKKIQDNKSNFVSFIDTFDHLNTIEKSLKTFIVITNITPSLEIRK